MTLPSSGPLSISQIAAEFGGVAPHSLSEYYGAASGVPSSGALSVSDFYGKSNLFTLNIAANSVNPNIRSLATAAGWNGSSRLVVNITAALINNLATGATAFPSGLEIILSAATFVGTDGGSAFRAQVPVTVDNKGTIAGNGGTGGRGQTFYYGSPVKYVNGGLGGNGQQFASNSTAILSAGAGATGESVNFNGFNTAKGGTGGTGGTWGVAGADGGPGVDNSGGIVLGTTGSTAGFGPGNAVNGNSFITWKSTGSRLGPIV